MKQILIGLLILCSMTLTPLFSDKAQLNPEQQKDKEMLETMLTQSPRHGGLMVSLAGIYAAAGMTQEALTWLEKAEASGIDLDPSGMTEFDSLQQHKDFKLIRDRFATRGPIIVSDLKLSLTEANLKPEGIAYDAVSKRFFLGSIRQCKIIAVDEAGRQTDFVSSGRDGLLGVLGLRVDEIRRHLWVCSNDRSPEGKKSPGIFQFDLTDGRLIKATLLPPDADKHLLNDLVVTKTGVVYASDSRFGVVYHLAADRLEPVTTPGDLLKVNGLCLDELDKALFISDFRYGLSRLDLQTRQILPLHHDPGLCTLGIDGLYLHQGRLLGIQNACGQERIVAFTLNEGHTGVMKMEVLERGNPRYQEAMTGAIAGDRFCFVAYGKGPAGRDLPPVAEGLPSAETVIMELKLK